MLLSSHIIHIHVTCFKWAIIKWIGWIFQPLVWQKWTPTEKSNLINIFKSTTTNKCYCPVRLYITSAASQILKEQIWNFLLVFRSVLYLWLLKHYTQLLKIQVVVIQVSNHQQCYVNSLLVSLQQQLLSSFEVSFPIPILEIATKSFSVSCCYLPDPISQNLRWHKPLPPAKIWCSIVRLKSCVQLLFPVNKHNIEMLWMKNWV